MVGGKVVEVAEVSDRPGILFVDCRDGKDACAIYVEKNADSDRIEIGDSLWWQGRFAYWTPQSHAGKETVEIDGVLVGCGKTYDIKIPRVGFSGVQHPSRETT